MSNFFVSKHDATRDSILSEIKQLEDIIENIPEQDVLTMQSYKARLNTIEKN